MKTSRRWAGPTLAVAAVLLGSASPAAASAAARPAPIGADQLFTALVNGSAVAARITVTCDGPADFVPSGHPVAGQTVAVTPARAPGAGVGFTGGTGAGVSTPEGVLRFYDNALAIPTDQLVPCSGAGTIAFKPVPSSPTARPVAVAVTFVSR